MQIWHAVPIRIPVKEFQVNVIADVSAVDVGKTIDDVYASDFRLTDEADVVALIGALQDGLVQMRSMRARP